MQTLKDLLEQAKDRYGGISGRRLADLASSAGHKIDRTQVNAILAGTYKHRPTPGLVRGIAWLANVTEKEAFAAARLPVPGPSFADELPPDADLLTPQQRAAVITMIRALLSAQDERLPEDAERPAHAIALTHGDQVVAQFNADEPAWTPWQTPSPVGPEEVTADEVQARRDAAIFEELVATIETEVDQGHVDVKHVRNLLVFLSPHHGDYFEIGRGLAGTLGLGGETLYASRELADEVAATEPGLEVVKSGNAWRVIKISPFTEDGLHLDTAASEDRDE